MSDEELLFVIVNVGWFIFGIFLIRFIMDSIEGYSDVSAYWQRRCERLTERLRERTDECTKLEEELERLTETGMRLIELTQEEGR